MSNPCHFILAGVTSPRAMAEAKNGAGSVGYQTRALERALSILDSFTAERSMLTVKDLHELLELPKPTISRLAAMLQRKGYLRRAGAGYELGPKTFELGSLYVRQHTALDSCRRPLEALATSSRQTSCLGQLAGSHIVHLLVVASPMPVQHVTETGSRAPAHATGLGKAMLSTLEPEELDGLLGPGPYPRFTANTISTREELLEELQLIRQRGYAVDDEESAHGLKCVAVGMEFENLGLAALSVSGPSADFQQGSIRSFVADLRASALEMQHSLSQAGDYGQSGSSLALVDGR